VIADRQAGLLRVARRLCAGREDDAQDLVQDTFAKGYAAYAGGALDIEGNVRAWLTRTLTHLYINQYHRRAKWDSGLSISADGEFDGGNDSGGTCPRGLRAASSDCPEESVVEPILDEHIEEALNRLSPLLRICVILVDIEGMDYASAAAELGLPVGTIRSRLSRARFQLHATLHDYAQSRRWL